jgi:N-acetylglucosamine-6-phosphate deacetylase
MERCALVGGRLVDPEAGEILEATLLVEDGRIVDRVPRGTAIGGSFRRVPVPDRLIAPGFVDVHFHGDLFHAPTAAFAGALERAAREMLADGTTAFLATTVSWSEDEIGERVGELARLVAEGDRAGAECLGLHLEGPWLSHVAPGAMVPGCLRGFRAERDAAVLDRAGEALRMVTLAPEVDGAGALLDALARRGVVASLGHSHATPETIEQGIDRGLRHVTHLFNAMGPVHHRAPGVAGTVLADDRLTCDLICDGHHVHPAMVLVAARALRERLVLITDRVDLPEGAAAPPAPDAAPGAPVRLPDGTIAGSQLGQGQALRNAMAFAGLPLVEAVAAATIRPARLLGVERDRGMLRPGGRADLAILDEQGNVLGTWVAGRPVYGEHAAEA